MRFPFDWPLPTILFLVSASFHVMGAWLFWRHGEGWLALGSVFVAVGAVVISVACVQMDRLHRRYMGMGRSVNL